MKTKIIFLVLFALILTACGGSDCKNGKECNKLAWDYWNKKEFNKAFKVFEKACDLENFEACNTLQLFYKYGIGTQKNEQKSKEYHQKAFELANKFCEKDDYKACNLLGQWYRVGLMVQEDENKARNLLQKACELRDYLSCMTLGDIENSAFITTRQELEYYQKAFKLAKEACEKDDYAACFLLSTLYKKLGILEILGLNKYKIDEFYQKGFKLAQKECLAGDYFKACGTLGLFYKDELGELKDIPKAIEAFEKSCDVYNRFTCWHLGILYENEKNIPKAKEYYKKVCDLGVTFACK